MGNLEVSKYEKARKRLGNFRIFEIAMFPSFLVEMVAKTFDDVQTQLRI